METTYIREARVNYHGGKSTAVRSPEDTVSFLRGVLPDNSREHFLALYLSANNSPIGYSVVATGCANSCPVHPREVFQAAIIVGATSIILAHNHPTGDLSESKDDIAVTERLKEASKLLGIKLLDHIILTNDDHKSLMH